MESTKSRGGRPAGRKKTAKIEVLVEPEVKKEFMRFIENDGKTASVEIYNWIRQYINKRKVEEK